MGQPLPFTNEFVQRAFSAGRVFTLDIPNFDTNWSQIQIESSIEDLKRRPFAEGKNCIHYPEGMDGDFEELTDYLMNQEHLVRQVVNGEETFTKRLLEPHESTCSDYSVVLASLLSSLSTSNELTAEGRKAALNFCERINQITSGIRADISKLLLQGPEFRSSEETPHTDGYASMRRIGCRVSGGETSVVHVDDVLQTTSGSHGYSALIDDARTKALGLCTVWANLQEVPVRERSALHKWWNRKKYDTTMESNTHFRTLNGKAGLIFTTNVPL